ncbi:hypothetical protein KAT36_00570 [Candidatus Pacearchaeota archaeon]|nr:hypothetical protein [Candidatus Pacearchaeota archaeon]
MRKEGKYYNMLFSELDLFILNKLLKGVPICVRALTIARKNSNNEIIQKKLENLIKLGLINREKPKGKRIDYSIKDIEKLKRLRDILNKTYNFYNPKKATSLNITIQAPKI